MMCSCVSTRGQRVGRVTGQHRHDGLVQELAVVELGGDAMHRHASELAAQFDRALVRVQAQEGRQQRGWMLTMRPR